MSSTIKNLSHISTIIDALGKFAWLYLVKTSDAIQNLNQQKAIFRNLARILLYPEFSFKIKEFKSYCEPENIKHITIITKVLRRNRQIEIFYIKIISM